MIADANANTNADLINVHRERTHQSTAAEILATIRN